MNGTGEMSEICVMPNILLDLLTELGRHRVLTDRETDLIEDIVNMELIAFRWNPRLDGQLKVASHSNGGIARFARRQGISDQAAYDRIYRIRKREKGKVAKCKAGG